MHFAALFCLGFSNKLRRGTREAGRPCIFPFFFPSTLWWLYPSLNEACLPDLPRMKCHISDWSLSLNRFLCLPWFPRPSLTSPLGHCPLMCQPHRNAGGGIFVICASVCVCVCVLKFCSELTKPPRGYQNSAAKETAERARCCVRLRHPRGFR